MNEYMKDGAGLRVLLVYRERKGRGIGISFGGTDDHHSAGVGERHDADRSKRKVV